MELRRFFRQIEKPLAHLRIEIIVLGKLSSGILVFDIAKYKPLEAYFCADACSQRRRPFHGHYLLGNENIQTTLIDNRPDIESQEKAVEGMSVKAKL
jgi:hypothetical protein